MVVELQHHGHTICYIFKHGYVNGYKNYTNTIKHTFPLLKSIIRSLTLINSPLKANCTDFKNDAHVYQCVSCVRWIGSNVTEILCLWSPEECELDVVELVKIVLNLCHFEPGRESLWKSVAWTWNSHTPEFHPLPSPPSYSVTTVKVH